MLYLRSHVALAEKAITDEKRLYRIRPKLHLLHHLFVRDGCANPHCYSTWMDEDAFKVHRPTDCRRASVAKVAAGTTVKLRGSPWKMRSRPIDFPGSMANSSMITYGGSRL